MRIHIKGEGWREATRQEWPKTLPLRDIMTHNTTAGKHFFEPATMHFFKSRVLGELAVLHETASRYLFLTSEKGPDGIRRYAIRQYNPDTGNVGTFGDSDEYVRGSLRQVRATLKHILQEQHEKQSTIGASA